MPIITLDSPQGIDYGFTSDVFAVGSYLWLDNKAKTITVSFIMCQEEGKGYFGKLLKDLWAKGMTVLVPTPLGRMVKILKHYGFKKGKVFDELLECPVEIWTKGP